MQNILNYSTCATWHVHNSNYMLDEGGGKRSLGGNVCIADAGLLLETTTGLEYETDDASESSFTIELKLGRFDGVPSQH